MKLFQNIFKNSDITICAPIKGKLVSIKTVNDPTFKDEILGKGIAIIPYEGKIYAPDSGTVSSVFPTGHAVIMVMNSGVELLIHFGIDTVKLNRDYFKVHVQNGQKVLKGELLIEADMEKIKEKGYDVITPVVVCNTEEFSQIEVVQEKEIQSGECVMILKQ